MAVALKKHQAGLQRGQQLRGGSDQAGVCVSRLRNKGMHSAVIEPTAQLSQRAKVAISHD